MWVPWIRPMVPHSIWQKGGEFTWFAQLPSRSMWKDRLWHALICIVVILCGLVCLVGWFEVFETVLLWSTVGLKPVLFLPPLSSVGIQVCAQKWDGFLFWLCIRIPWTTCEEDRLPVSLPPLFGKSITPWHRVHSETLAFLPFPLSQPLPDSWGKIALSNPSGPKTKCQAKLVRVAYDPVLTGLCHQPEWQVEQAVEATGSHSCP